MLLGIWGLLLIGLYSFRWNIPRYAGHLESMAIDQIDYTSVQWLLSCFVESWFLQKQENVFWNTLYVSEQTDSLETTETTGGIYDEFDSFFGEDGSNGTGTQESLFQEQWYGFVDQPNASGIIERTYYDDWTTDSDIQLQKNPESWQNQVSSGTKRYLENLIQMRTTQSFKTWN